MKKKFSGERLKRKRNEKGLSRKALANLIGCSEKSIERWENGKCQPNGETICAICEALGIKWEELYDEQQDENK